MFQPICRTSDYVTANHSISTFTANESRPHDATQLDHSSSLHTNDSTWIRFENITTQSDDIDNSDFYASLIVVCTIVAIIFFVIMNEILHRYTSHHRLIRRDTTTVQDNDFTPLITVA